MREQERRRSAAAPPLRARRACASALWLKHRGENILLPPPRLWGPSGSLEARSPEAPRGAEGSERGPSRAPWGRSNLRVRRDPHVGAAPGNPSALLDLPRASPGSSSRPRRHGCRFRGRRGRKRRGRRCRGGGLRRRRPPSLRRLVGRGAVPDPRMPVLGAPGAKGPVEAGLLLRQMRWQARRRGLGDRREEALRALHGGEAQPRPRAGRRRRAGWPPPEA